MDAARSGLGIAEPSHNRWPLVLAVIGVALIGAALLTVFLMRGGAGGPTTAGRLMAIDPATNKVAATARVGAEPSAVAAGAGRIWVTTLADDGLWLIDPKTLGVQRIAANGYPVGVAISGGTAFVAADSAPYGPDVGSVTPVDAKSGNALDAIPTAGASAIAGGPDVWLVHGGRWVGSLAGEQNPFGELLRVGASEATGTLSRNSRTLRDPHPAAHSDPRPSGQRGEFRRRRRPGDWRGRDLGARRRPHADTVEDRSCRRAYRGQGPAPVRAEERRGWGRSDVGHGPARRFRRTDRPGHRSDRGEDQGGARAERGGRRRRLGLGGGHDRPNGDENRPAVRPGRRDDPRRREPGQ